MGAEGTGLRGSLQVTVAGLRRRHVGAEGAALPGCRLTPPPTPPRPRAEGEGGGGEVRPPPPPEEEEEAETMLETLRERLLSVQQDFTSGWVAPIVPGGVAGPAARPG